MRILADECVLRGAVMGLRAAGHDVEWIAEVAPSLPDVEVLARARDQDRILVTNDTDFGQLVFQARQIVEAMSRLEGLPWRDSFVVVESGHIRTTPFPGASQ